VPVEGAAHAQHELDGVGRQLVLVQGALRLGSGTAATITGADASAKRITFAA